METSTYIKKKARKLGFDLIGITNTDPFTRTETRLRLRKKQGLFPDLMPDSSIKQLTHPRQLLPGAESIISLAMSYAPSPDDQSQGPAAISRYALGQDYHRVLRKKITHLLDYLQELDNNIDNRVIVDSGPLLEKNVAHRAGLGWIGKNSSFINKRYGSYIFLGEIITTLKLKIDSPATEGCGDCQQCLQKCPTGAIGENHQFDYRKCISYLTQKRGMISPEERKLIGNNLWGCDRCQQACPYNQQIPTDLHREFRPLISPDIDKILGFPNNKLPEKWQQAALSWRGSRILRRNAIIVLTNQGLTEYIPRLRELLEDPSPLIRAYVIWALFQLDNGFKRKQLLKLKERETENYPIREINNLLKPNRE